MKIHFIGIGGIGASALAQYYHYKGHKVSGSDLVFSEITDFLKKIGIKITQNSNVKTQNYDSKIKNNKLPDLVIYSLAVKKDNPELEFYRKKGIDCLSYPEALGKLTKKYFTIAISGTHGKSTTTAMISLILIKAGFDPTVIIGTKLKEFKNSNFRAGKSKYLVIEADEHFASFLNYWPKIIVLTNIEREHLDYFKNIKRILKTYREYIEHLPKKGILVINKEDENIKKIFNQNFYFLKNKGLARSSNLLFKKPDFKFQILDYSLKQKEAENLKKILKVPGQHNIYNGLAALTVAKFLKIPNNVSFQALSEYKSCWRRFEIKQGRVNGKKIIVVSDYGHHPTEISATLKTAREKYPKNKIWCVFQPHQYQRTYYLFNDFVKVFRQALIDKIIITDIYDVAGRETKEINKKISSQKLVEKIKRDNIIYLPINKIENYIKKNMKEKDILVIMGAGDIYKLSDKF